MGRRRAVAAPGAAPSPAAASKSTTRSLAIPDFRRLWVGSLLQSLARWVQTATVPYLIYLETRSGVWLGAAASALFGPGLVTTTVGGVLADRVDRRRLIAVVQALLVANAAAVATAWGTGHHPATLLLILVAVDGALFGITAPVRQSVVSDLVPRSDLYSAIALTSAQFNVGKAAGPALAGLLLAVAAPIAPLLLVVTLHGCALVAALRLRIPGRPTASGPVLRSILGGYSCVKAEPGLRMAFTLVAFHACVATSTFSVLPVLPTRVYHTGGLGYGILAAAYGTGAMVNALVGGGRLNGIPSGTILRRVAPLYTAALLALACNGWFVAELLILGVNGACFQTVQNAITASVQRQASIAVRGRVLGAYFTTLTASLAVGGFALGALSDRIGIVDTLLAAATVFGAGTAIFLAMPRAADLVSSRGVDDMATVTPVVIEAAAVPIR